MTLTRTELFLKNTSQQKNKHNYSTQPIHSGPFMMIHQKLQIMHYTSYLHSCNFQANLA
jgi:hypothetical protein